MRKMYKSKIYKVALFWLLSFSFIANITAQVDITIGTGTTTNTGTTYPCPMHDWFEGSRAQYLYRASELTAAGMGPGNIVGLKWTVTGLNTFSGAVEQFSIRIGTTSVTTLSATAWETGTVQVRAQSNYTPTVGVNSFVFSTPFFWNGTDNVIVEVCNGDPTNASGTFFTNNPSVTMTTGLSFNGSHSYRADNLGNLCGTATTTNTGNLTDRPNVIFSWISAVACSGTPTGGTAIASPALVCFGEPFSISVTGSSLASGLTYQWESSTNGTTYTPISGATSSILNSSQTVSTWYRRVVTCTNSGLSSNSTSVQVVSPSLVGGTFTINNALPTGGINFNSFNDAYNYIKCGINAPVIFNVDAASGPYNEQLIMTPVPGASNVNTVTFNGNAKTLQFTSTNTNERAVIKLNGADHIRFNDLVINANGTTTTEYGFGVQLLNNADSNKVTNCTININKTSTSTNYGGIIMNASATSATTTGATNCNANEFSGNTIIGGYYGFTMVGSTTQSVARNIISNNKLFDQYFYGIYLLGNFNSQITGNEIARPTRTGNPTLSYGIFVTSLNTSVNITRNKIHSPFESEQTTTNDYYGITHSGSDALATLENFVTNNAIYNFKSNGTIYGIYNTSSDNVWYHHNTIVFDHTASTSTEAARGFFQTTLAGGVEFRNNIVTMNRGGTGLKHAIYFATSTSIIISNTNNFDVTPSATTHVGFFTSNQTALANWQAAATQDANSVVLNPIYVNSINGIFQPTNASMDNLGAPLGIAIDIMNAARSATTPDIGAWEFTPGACVAPPIAGTSISSISVPVCPNTPASFNLTGNSIGLGQTYLWQFSTSISGPYTNIGTSTTNPTLNYNVLQTGYYRCEVTCAGSTVFSTPVLVNVKSLLAGGTYTINSTLPASATNFPSFNAAYIAMECGITGPIVLNVTTPPGTTYNEQLLMNTIQGMNATNTVTWNGNGNIISFASTNTNERSVIRLNGISHMRFDNLVVNPLGSATTEYGHGFHLQNNCDSNVVRNCTINLSTTTISTNFAGIVISGGNTATTTTNNLCDSNTIENNTITGGYYGITLASLTANPAVNNRFISNKIKDFYSFGIYHSTANNTLIESNELSMPTRTTSTTTYGIYSIGALQNLVISKNRVFDFFKSNTASTSIGYGIYSSSDATAGQEIQIRNNAIYNWKGQGTAYGIFIFSDFANIYHNTVDFNDQSFTGTGITTCLHYGGASNSNNIRNNLFTITKSGTANKFGINFATIPTNYTTNYNNFYITGTNAHVGFLTSNRTTLANWQAATSQEANSLNANPFYVSPTTGNLQPFSALLDNKGTNVNITTDIINATRSATTPDIGAWEFAVPPCTAPPVVSTAVATPNTAICMGTDVFLKLTGIVFGSGQTYQWQTATSLAGPYTNMGNVMQFPDTTVVASTTLYYRCVVTCSGQSTPSNPALVSLNSAFLAGTYTINPALPASATNFTSFNTAVAALYCGITGHVIFNVASGTHNEQVRVGRIPGVSPSATVTFQSATGNPADVTLSFGSTVAANNYTLLLDSTGYFTFRNMTITGTNTTQGRVVELRNIANNNTIRNTIINAPIGAAATNTLAGIFSNSLSGIGTNSIINNTINGGNFGITLIGLNNTSPSNNNVVDSNTFNNNFAQSLQLQYMDYVKVRANIINMIGVRNATTYGMNINDCDSSIVFDKNRVNISNVTTTFYGLSFTACIANANDPGLITNNTVLATTGNTATGYGLYQTTGVRLKFRNNVVSMNSATTAGVYGLYHTNGTVDYENNSINNNSSSTNALNVTAYLNQTSGTTGQSFARNNIFAHNNGGRAIFMANSNFVYSDYNMLYTNGTNIGTFGTAAITTFKRWVDTTNWDYHSISYKPAFIANDNLQPDIASAQVWGMHGRGVQITSNDKDFNGAARPVTLQAGVPDLGAYEFVPTSTPENLVATPATPTANTTQKFSLGTDTVSIIKWGATVPSTITGKRYTGTVPPALVVGQQYMYFYTDFDVPTGSYNYEIQQNYMNPWRGFLPNETVGKLGRTNAANTWIVAPTSTVDTLVNFVKEPNLTFIDKYTVLTDGNVAPPPPIDPIVLDTSNMGTRFWVGYGHNQLFSGNSQQMVLYLGGSTTPATVTVRINGTPWIRTYTIPANTIISSDLIPKSGLFDARLLNEGFSERGISITSNVPIVAYAHGYGSASSGASMLMPVGVYGYEYYSTNFRQNYASDCFSWFYVVSDRNNSLIEITPSNPTRDGRPANVPFIVTLNKGEVYQVLGAIQTGSRGYDMTGSKAKAVPNSEGKCHPFAFFSGSSRTAIYCGGLESTGNGDYINQQNFPSQAWGKRYLVAPTSNTSAANSFHQNIFRVVVKDATTVVQRNGVTLTGLVNNRFYEFDSQTADYITADKPVMVAQYQASSGSNCNNVAGNGDPEMIYVSPIEQGIKRVVLYRNTQQAITTNDIQVIIPTGGVASLLIDGSNTFTHTYPHPNLSGYTVVIRRYTAAATQATVVSDSAFTLITYGMGSVESYGYNGGTLVKNLNAVSSISNTLSTSGGSSPYTCAGTPFRFKVLLSIQPTQLTWQFSQVPGLSPNVDVIQNNPVSTGTQIINGNTYYEYTIASNYTFAAPGNYLVPVNLVHPTFEGCNSSQDITVSVTVLPEPVTDFTGVFNTCVNDLIQFNGTSIMNGSATVNNWAWNFGNSNLSNIQNPTQSFTTAGTYNVNLQTVGSDGCLGDTTKQVVVNPRPTMNAVADKFACNGATIAAINFTSNTTGTIYNWTNNNTAIGLTASGTGNIASFNAINTGNTPLVATIIVNPVFINGTANCDGIKDTFLITVNPTPTVNAITNQAYCHNTVTTITNISGAVSGTTYTWTNSNTSIGLAASGTGNIPSFTAINTGTTSQVATITITPVYGVLPNICNGTPITFTITVNPLPTVNLVTDSLSICINTNGTFTVQNPIAGATYNWYNAATGGTLLSTGVSYTLNNVTTNTQVWVEGAVNGCNSSTRKRAIVTVLPLLTPPLPVVDLVGVNFITWRWNAVPNALSYSVSQNNGSTWNLPSSGANGLTHTINNLLPLTSVTLLVRANGGCQDATSQPITGKTLTDQLYFPNSFTPNGDGLNDVWKVYGYIIKDLRIAIFNQWGEKIFESRNQSQGWDGKYKGKVQPAGVYMYVVDITLNDGTKKLEKGSINLLH